MDKSIASKLCIFNDQKFSQFGENHFINNALTHCWVKCINTFTVKSSVITLKYHLLVALTKVSFSKLSFPVVSIFQLISIMSFYLSLLSLSSLSSLSPLSLLSLSLRWFLWFAICLLWCIYSNGKMFHFCEHLSSCYRNLFFRRHRSFQRK